jgi:hypothetical protein
MLPKTVEEPTVPSFKSVPPAPPAPIVTVIADPAVTG